jgi:hypothetical protein
VGRELEDGEFGNEIGEYGKALKAILKKYICPICRSAYDSEAEALRCIVEEHGVDQLD